MILTNILVSFSRAYKVRYHIRFCTLCYISDMNDQLEFGQLILEYVKQLREESERGAVIVSAALMDEALEELIKAKLVPSPEKKDELFIGAYAPLDNFSAKIDFAYRIGIIGFSIRASLHLLRKLRNDFAHSALQMSFDSSSVRDRIRELFKLNKELLDVLWDVAKKENNPYIAEITGGIDSKQGIDYLVEIAGWRSIFQILVSLISASLRQHYGDIEPLKSLAD